MKVVVLIVSFLIASMSMPGTLANQTNKKYSQSPLPTVEVGDIERGKNVFLDRDRGHCLLCHQVQQLDARFQGNIGPDLSNVGERLNVDEIRYRIVDSTRINPETSMPAYYRTANLTQVAKEFAGKPVLNAQEVEDLVAFLAALESTERESRQ